MYHRSNLNFIVPLFSYDSWHATFPLNTKLRIQGVILHFSNWSCNHGGCTFLFIIRGCKSTSGTFCAPSEFKSTPLLVSQEFIAVISTSMEQVEVNRLFESRCYLSSRTATWKKIKDFYSIFLFSGSRSKICALLNPRKCAMAPVHPWIANYVDPRPPSLTIRA